jgi:hypothetical protein
MYDVYKHYEQGGITGAVWGLRCPKCSGEPAPQPVKMNFTTREVVIQEMLAELRSGGPEGLLATLARRVIIGYLRAKLEDS